ncbi:MAG TPA: NAD-dependent epimerase/dehydratase family protein [Myxococcales bacterium]|jgi:nucleoside-diphosphate-sugar epimerase
MILFGKSTRLSFWLEQDEAARALSCDPFDRRALRADLDQLRPGGDTTLVLDAAGTRLRRTEDALKAAQEFTVWAEERAVRPRVVLVSCDSVYGVLKPGVALREQDAAPTDEASEALLAVERGLVDLARRRGFGLAIARLFEVIDPREPSPRLLDLAGRVQAARMKGIPELGATRDYIDARDAAKALLALAGLVDSPTVNVCSGRPISGHDLVRAMVRLIRPVDEARLMASVEAQTAEEAGAAQRPIPWIVGNPAHFTAMVGFAASIRTFEQTLKEACCLL